MVRGGLNRVLVVGAGALGSNIVRELIKEGFVVGVADGDFVEERNLSIQRVYDYKDVGKKKVKALKEMFGNLNVYDTFINLDNVRDIMGGYDIVVDATDNMWSKFLLSIYSLREGKDFVFGGLRGNEGLAGKNVCLMCNLPYEDSESCAETFTTLDTALNVANLEVEMVRRISRGDRESEILYYDSGEILSFRPLPCSDKHEDFDIFISRQKAEDRGYIIVHADEVDIGSIPIDKPIAVYCEYGIKSFKVSKKLREMGYESYALEPVKICGYTHSYS